MSVYLKEYFDIDNENNIKPRTTMRANRWFLFMGDILYGQVRPPTNYYELRDGLIDGRMLFEKDDTVILPTNKKLDEITFSALGPLGDLVEVTTFKNVIFYLSLNRKNSAIWVPSTVSVLLPIVIVPLHII